MEKRYFTSDFSRISKDLFNLLDIYYFYVGGDVVLPAEIEHLLGFGDAADVRAGKAAAAHNQAEADRGCSW